MLGAALISLAVNRIGQLERCATVAAMQPPDEAWVGATSWATKGHDLRYSREEEE